MRMASEHQPPAQAGKRTVVAIDVTFQRGVALQRQGRLAEAERLYEEVIQRDPRHFGALHLLGRAALQTGRAHRGIELIAKAIGLNRGVASAHSDLGKGLSGLGRLDEALASFDRAIALRPDHAPAHNNRGRALIDLGRLDEALASFDRAIALQPDFAFAHNNRGVALSELGRCDEALAHYDKAIALRPDYAEAHNSRGLALSDLRRFEEALASFDNAIALKPDFAPAYGNRAFALRELRRFDEALANCDKAIALRPDNAPAYCNRGIALRDLRRFDEALASYDQAIGLRADYPLAYGDRGIVLAELRRFDEALASFDRAIALQPDYAMAYGNRGLVLAELRRFDEALASHDKALALRPDYAEALNSRGNALRDLNRPEEALASFDRALAVKPDFSDACGNKGILLLELGRIEEARSAIEAAIRLDPRRARLYHVLTKSKRVERGDSCLQAMEEMARDSPSLDASEQIYLHFALSKAFADVGDRERSFKSLLEGAELKRRQIVYDEAAALEALERTEAGFTAELARRHEGAGEPSSLPIFIVGMPRSGTTLVEQILASHPKVFGAGEISDFDQALREVGAAVAPGRRFPEIVSLMSAGDLRRLGANYVGRLRAAAPTAERIANKEVSNFRHVGLIHLALPNARVIHVRRDPIDTCFSCFSKLFVQDQAPYSYDLRELGRYYRAYEALMAHWRRVLPQSAMLEAQYEDVVGDLEGQARRIVAYCGLEWDARCLDFHRTQRHVRTASLAEVRQPIYASSVGRWRAYEAFLEPLRAELEADVPQSTPG
jgi:tetratricopeptide (TPR) repeat protein